MSRELGRVSRRSLETSVQQNANSRSHYSGLGEAEGATATAGHCEVHVTRTDCLMTVLRTGIPYSKFASGPSRTQLPAPYPPEFGESPIRVSRAGSLSHRQGDLFEDVILWRGEERPLWLLTADVYELVPPTSRPRVTICLRITSLSSGEYQTSWTTFPASTE